MVFVIYIFEDLEVGRVFVVFIVVVFVVDVIYCYG